MYIIKAIYKGIFIKEIILTSSNKDKKIFKKFKRASNILYENLKKRQSNNIYQQTELQLINEKNDVIFSYIYHFNNTEEDFSWAIIKTASSLIQY